MGNENEHRICRRFLDHLQKPVCSLLIHLLRKVEYDGLVSVRYRCKRELADYGLSLSHSNQAALAFYSYGLLQVRLHEIWICKDQLTPILDV